MLKKLDVTVDRLRKDLTGGASQTAREVAECLAAVCEAAGSESKIVVKTLEDASRAILQVQPFMASIKHVVNLGLCNAESLAAKWDGTGHFGRAVADGFMEFNRQSQDATEQIAKAGARRIAGKKRVFVFSLSGTVMAVMEEAAKASCSLPHVVITEAKPGCEGVEAARLMAEMGYNVTLMADAAMVLAVRDCDYALVGADSVSSTGDMVNKTGTALAAICCRHSNVPFAVATESYKFDPATILGFPHQNLEGRAEQVVEGKVHQNVDIANPQVDVTSADLVTEYITEQGIWGGEAYHRLAPASALNPRFVKIVEDLSTDPLYLTARRESL